MGQRNEGFSDKTFRARITSEGGGSSNAETRTPHDEIPVGIAPVHSVTPRGADETRIEIEGARMDLAPGTYKFRIHEATSSGQNIDFVGRVSPKKDPREPLVYFGPIPPIEDGEYTVDVRHIGPIPPDDEGLGGDTRGGKPDDALPDYLRD